MEAGCDGGEGSTKKDACQKNHRRALTSQDRARAAGRNIRIVGWPSVTEQRKGPDPKNREDSRLRGRCVAFIGRVRRKIACGKPREDSIAGSEAETGKYVESGSMNIFLVSLSNLQEGFGARSIRLGEKQGRSARLGRRKGEASLHCSWIERE